MIQGGESPSNHGRIVAGCPRNSRAINLHETAIHHPSARWRYITRLRTSISLASSGRVYKFRIAPYLNQSSIAGSLHSYIIALEPVKISSRARAPSPWSKSTSSFFAKGTNAGAPRAGANSVPHKVCSTTCHSVLDPCSVAQFFRKVFFGEVLKPEARQGLNFCFFLPLHHQVQFSIPIRILLDKLLLQ
jgi:hypothetical protein